MDVRFLFDYDLPKGVKSVYIKDKKYSRAEFIELKNQSQQNKEGKIEI